MRSVGHGLPPLTSSAAMLTTSSPSGSFSAGSRGWHRDKFCFYWLHLRSTKFQMPKWYYSRVSPHAYLMTRSALASMLGGIVTPIAFAVLRFITSSNFVGCSTGRSAGLAPFKILST